MDTLTFPSPDLIYPLTLELDGDRLFGACGLIHDCLQEMQHKEGHPGFEIFFAGTSGSTFATALAAMNRAKSAPMDLAYCQVAKTKDMGAHHRCMVETTHSIREKEGFPRIFLDDFTASGETFRRTLNHVKTAAGKSMHHISPEFECFDGVIVLSGEVREDIRDQINFVIRPDDY